MLGAIIGDIVGSSYEVLEINKKRNYEDRLKILNPNTSLFAPNSSCTDDSILTAAIAEAVLNDQQYEKYLKEYGQKELAKGLDIYGRNPFSKGFINWLNQDTQGKSIGNGSAMRVAPVAYYFDNLEMITKNTILATIPSHNSKEALKGALAVSHTIFLARNHVEKKIIKKYIEEKFHYNLDFNLDDLQKNYRFYSTCEKTVPQAIYIFLTSKNFENALRLSLSIGGDTDTIACIVGAISEAYYNIPKEIYLQACKFIPDYIMEVIKKFYKERGKNMYQLNDRTKDNITEILGISYEKFISLTVEEQMKLINKIEEEKKHLNIDEKINKVLSKKIH